MLSITETIKEVIDLNKCSTPPPPPATQKGHKMEII
jgi:hypothetical protein